MEITTKILSTVSLKIPTAISLKIPFMTFSLRIPPTKQVRTHSTIFFLIYLQAYLLKDTIDNFFVLFSPWYFLSTFLVFFFGTYFCFFFRNFNFCRGQVEVQFLQNFVLLTPFKIRPVIYVKIHVLVVETLKIPSSISHKSCGSFLIISFDNSIDFFFQRILRSFLALFFLQTTLRILFGVLSGYFQELFQRCFLEISLPFTYENSMDFLTRILSTDPLTIAQGISTAVCYRMIFENTFSNFFWASFEILFGDSFSHFLFFNLFQFILWKFL